MRKKAQELLSKNYAGDFNSFIINCWLGTTESISLTVHFINNNWKTIDIVLILLNVKTMEGSHTGKYLASNFIAMLEEWQISKEKIKLILRDSGANIVKGTNLVEIPNLSCLAHTLKLVVNDGLQAQ